MATHEETATTVPIGECNRKTGGRSCVCVLRGMSVHKHLKSPDTSEGCVIPTDVNSMLWILSLLHGCTLSILSKDGSQHVGLRLVKLEAQEIAGGTN